MKNTYEYFYSMRYSIKYIVIALLLCVSATMYAATFTNKSAGGNWNDAANWDRGSVPGPGDDAVINVHIKVDGNDCKCRNIQIKSGRSLTINDGCNLYVYRDLIVDGGTIGVESGWGKSGSGKLIMCGSDRQQIRGSSTMIKITNFVVANTSGNSDVQKGIHLLSGRDLDVTNKLTMISGVFHVDDENNYIITSKSTLGSSEQFLELTSGYDEATCYIDGELRRWMYANGRPWVFPIGDGLRSGYALAKYPSRFGAYYLIVMRYHNKKADQRGTDQVAYDLLGKEYWSAYYLERTGINGADLNFTFYFRVDDTKLVDYSPSNSSGTISGTYLSQATDKVNWSPWSENLVTNAGVVEGMPLKTGWAVCANAALTGYCEFTYGVKDKFVQQIKNTNKKTLGYKWTGLGDDNDWNNRRNWLSEEVPNASSNVSIARKYDINYMLDNGSVFTISHEVPAGNFTPTVKAGGSAAVANLLTIDGEGMSLNIENGNSLAVNNNLEIKIGDVTNNGTLNVTGLTYVKQNPALSNDVTMVNNGTATLTGQVLVGGTLENNGTLNIGSLMTVFGSCEVVGNASGKMIFTKASDNAIENNGIFSPEGSVVVNADVLNRATFTPASIEMSNTSGNTQSLVSDGGSYEIGTLIVGNNVIARNGNVIVTKQLDLNGVVTITSDDPSNSFNLWLKGNTLNRTNGYIDGIFYRTLPSLSDKRNVDMQYLFPVGDGAKYAFAKIGPNNSNEVVGVQYFNVKPTQGSGSELYGNLSSEYWKVVTKSGELAGNVYITLNYDNSDNFEPALADYYSLAHYDGVRWTVYDRDEANNKAGIDAVNKLVYYKTGISVNNDGPTAHLFTLGYTKRVDRWTGSKSSAWSDDDNWSGGLVPSVMAFIPSLGAGAHNYPVIGTADNVGLTSVVVDGNQATLTINGGTLNTDALTVTDNTNPGHVIINQRYDQSSNLIFGSTNYNGNFTVNRTLKQNVLHYVGSATSEGSFTGFDSGAGDYMANYDASTEDYVNVSSNPQFPADWYGTSIGLKHSGAQIQQIGTVATGNVTMAAPLKSASDWYGWNLLSNPYQAALNMTKSFASFDHVEPVVWFRCFDDAQKAYKYTTYSVVAGVQVSQGKPGAEPIAAIAPQQAFFVRTTSPYATPNVTFKAPTSDLIVAAGTKLKAEKVVNDCLRLNVISDDAMGDEMALVFRDGGSMEITQNDALKRLDGASYNQIYAVKENGNFAIPFYPVAEEVGSTLIPIGVQLASGAQEGVILASNIEQFTASDIVLLHDLDEDVTVNLREIGEYHFVAPAGQRINGRFAISLKSLEVEGDETEEGTATGIAQSRVNSIMIMQNDDRDAVVSIPAEMLADAAVVNVYDMAGKLVKKQSLEQTKTVVTLGDKKGVYIVEAMSGNATERQKLRK